VNGAAASSSPSPLHLPAGSCPQHGPQTLVQVIWSSMGPRCGRCGGPLEEVRP
jgi:hypothetical protein